MEDCERKYKEAFNMAVLEHKSDNEAVRESIERIFPQLKEPEDEKIRKALFEYFTTSDNNAYYEVCGVATKKILTWLEKQGEQKPFAWSKEDKGVLLESISVLQSSSHWVLADKLKSLKDRVGCEVNCTTTSEPVVRGNKGNYGGISPNSEWGEEDEEMIDNIIDYMMPMPIFFESTKGKSGKEYTQEFIKEATKWLKSIRTQKRWKPTKDQIDALFAAVYLKALRNTLEKDSVKQLEELYNQLKKLKE